MTYPKSVIVTFIKSDFDGNGYMNIYDCPLARAATREMKEYLIVDDFISVGWCEFRIANQKVTSTAYSGNDKLWDEKVYKKLKKQFANGENPNYSLTLQRDF